MRRFHEERDLMLRRWRKELAKHGDPHPHSKDKWVGGPYDSMLPASMACLIDCHCAKGPGTMRKNRLDCGKPRCGLCHHDKFYADKARHRKKQREIQYQLDAEGAG